jgi:hypothetical protein
MKTTMAEIRWVTVCVLTAFALAGAEPPRPPLDYPPELKASAANTQGGRIQFATSTFDFGKVMAGKVVKLEFAFTNTGTAQLQVNEVRASCGCTTTGSWSRQVEPGKTGTIPIEFHSQNFSGPISKTITVTCNDPQQPLVTLFVKGTVWRPIEVTPQFAVLNVLPDSPTSATTSVRIVSHLDTPLTLSPPESNNPAFAAELTIVQPGKEYQMLIKLVSTVGTGATYGKITLKTSAPDLPTLEVTAYAAAQPAVSTTPSQVILPSGPLTNQIVQTVAVRTISTNALVLTDPVLEAKGAAMDMKELQPGRYFTFTLSFPEGFQLPAGSQGELRVKSNHPQYPLIRVPIIQRPKPVITGTVPASVRPTAATTPAPPPPSLPVTR